jgi:protease-4
VLFGLFCFFVFVVGIGGVLLMHMIGIGGGDSIGGDLSFGDKIGLVRIEGEIMPGADVDFLLKSLRDMGKSRSVRGIVLRINSPGGSVGASQEIQAMVMRVRNEYKKPVFVSMGDVAASGGYYIASAADRIYALKGTLTGSIGVIMEKPDISQLAEKLGITMENIKTGKFKDSGMMTRSLTPDEKAMFDNLIMNTYGQFLTDVLITREDRIDKAMRTISPEHWSKYAFATPENTSARGYLTVMADGRAYTGEQGLELGLVDDIGTLDDTIRAMADRLKLSGWSNIEEATRQPTLRELLGSKLGFFLPHSEAPLQYRMPLP